MQQLPIYTVDNNDRSSLPIPNLDVILLGSRHGSWDVTYMTDKHGKVEGRCPLDEPFDIREVDTSLKAYEDVCDDDGNYIAHHLIVTLQDGDVVDVEDGLKWCYQHDLWAICDPDVWPFQDYDSLQAAYLAKIIKQIKPPVVEFAGQFDGDPYELQRHTYRWNDKIWEPCYRVYFPTERDADVYGEYSPMYSD